MEYNQGGINLTELIEKNTNKLRAFEKISVFVFVLGLLLYLTKMPYANILVIIGSIMTAICYFLYGFKFIETENLETTGVLNSIGFINFMYKLMYYSLSISAIAMLGLVIQFKNGNSMLFIGGISLMIILFLSLITKLSDRSVIYNSMFYIRIVIGLFLLTYLALIQFNTL